MVYRNDSTFVKTTIPSPTPKNIEFIYFDPNEERNNFFREHTTNNLHKAYTDGSEKNKKMGSAIMKINENEMKQKVLIQPSFTKAEITAIYANNLTTTTRNLEILTASQTTINIIEKLKNNPTQREIVKIKDYPFYEAILHQIEQNGHAWT